MLHNAPSLEKGRLGWITLDRKQHIKRYVDTFEKGLSDTTDQSKTVVFVLTD